MLLLFLVGLIILIMYIEHVLINALSAILRSRVDSLRSRVILRE